MDIYPLFFKPGEVAEIRAVGIAAKKNKAWEGFAASGIVSGYFDDPGAFQQSADVLDRAEAKGVYVTINPVNPALLARAVNRLKVQKTTTQDKDIVCIRWLPIDLDPRRPADISSTEEETKAAAELARRIAAWLEGELGFARGVRAFSGNGFHLLYRLPDLPNNEETHQLIVSALAAIEGKFHNDQVDIDLTTVNPARIWKLYGTTGRKGDSTKDRPHRKSYVYPGQPEKEEDVPVTAIESLRTLAAVPAKAPAPADAGQAAPASLPPAKLPAAAGSPKGAARPFKGGELGPVDVDRYLQHHGIQYTVKTKGAQTLYVLEKCLFNPDHGPGEASIISAPTGKSPLLYQCFHASCKDKRWKDARQIISGDKPIAQFCAGYDPDWKPPRSEGSGAMAEIQVRTETGIESEAQVEPPEKVDPLEFFEKRGKRPVFVPLYLANYLASYLNPIVHTSGVFWRYRDGLWKPFPETTINQVIGTSLKERWQGDFQSNVVKRLKGLVNQEEDQWSNEPSLIPCANGMLDINTMTLLPHDPKYGNRYRLPVSYKEKAWSSRWWDYMEEVFPEDTKCAKRHILQQFWGYCLTRDCRYQVCLFLYGTGANGKSTMLDVLQAMLGPENCSSMSLQDLSERFKPQFLQNKLVNLATETESRDPMGTEMLKKLITGDVITCERKYGDQFQFRSYAKFIAALNDSPVIPDKSYGFNRRVIVVNHERRFLPEEIAAKTEAIGGKKLSDWLIEEIDGVFGWALEGLRALIANHGFRIDEEVRKDTDNLMETLNPLLIFVKEMCEIHDGIHVGTVELWECYKAWCADGKNRPLGRNKFYDQIRQTFTRVKDCELPDSRMRGFEGICLTASAKAWLADWKHRSHRRDQQELPD